MYATRERTPRRVSPWTTTAMTAALLLTLAPFAPGQQAAPASVAVPDAPAPSTSPRIEIYGHAMADFGYDFRQMDPKWFDVMRPTKLPSVPGQFGEDGTFYAGVRQSRFGTRAQMPTPMGELKAQFEFEMFGTGVDAGQTTFRLRHFYGEAGHFGAGQTWSPFMDSDMLPGVLDHWGPSGLVVYRNVQARWMPLMGGPTTVTLALERPGGAGDEGIYADRIEVQNVRGRFPLPDLSGHVRRKTGWGHVQLAGIVRRINWDDTLDDEFDLSGGTTAWGVHVSSNVKVSHGTLRASAVYGPGIQNYMNDAAVEIGIQNNFSNPRTPIVGKALPVLGLTAYFDARWNPKWTSSIGYSFMDTDNADAQTPQAFRRAHYVATNLLHQPVPGLTVGGEVQWARRENHSDGYHSDGLRLQVSVKYAFSYKFGG